MVKSAASREPPVLVTEQSPLKMSAAITEWRHWVLPLSWTELRAVFLVLLVRRTCSCILATFWGSNLMHLLEKCLSFASGEASMKEKEKKERRREKNERGGEKRPVYQHRGLCTQT